MHILTIPCKEGQVFPVCPTPLTEVETHLSRVRPLPIWPVGTVLSAGNKDIFRVVGRVLLLLGDSAHSTHCPMLKTLTPVHGGEMMFKVNRAAKALAWITLSDKGACGEREDTSGPAIGEAIRNAMPLSHEQGFLLPDDENALRTLLLELAFGQGYDLIITTGGTGLGERDVSPEATLRVIDKRLHGFEHAMMQTSLSKTPHAMISRAVVGVIGKSICINLPGSKKAVLENLQAILPALPHALEKLQGDESDCARL